MAQPHGLTIHHGRHHAERAISMPYLCHCRFPSLGLADLWRVTEERGALSEEFGRKVARAPGRIALPVGRFVGDYGIKIALLLVRLSL